MNQGSSGASILVVDDTTENLRLLSTILTERGHEVRPVTSGRLALEAAASFPPDAILLDVNMPEMDGMEVCARLKKIKALRDIPVIFITALADTADKMKGFAVGGVDFITKPFQVEEVLARVEVHVALRRSRAEVQASYDQLRGLERLRHELVHMIVHDLRSPLGALMMLLEFVRDSAGDRLAGDGAECLQTAIQAANSVNRMANDLLDVSRLEEGKLPLKPEKVDVVTLCGAAIELLGSMDKSRHVELATTHPVEASLDRNLIRRVIENLVGNAIKHASSAGKVVVAASLGEQLLRVEVRDDGRGVPAEARERIFEKFGTLDSPTASRYHSAGLGLTFCRMAVEAHGGRIGVEPVEPQGSTFWFELPQPPRP